MLDNHRIPKEDYDNLNTEEKNLIENLAFYIPIDTFVFDSQQTFTDEFKKLIGIVKAGNENPLITKRLKQYIAHGVNTGYISRHLGEKINADLDL